jgi:acyl-CoA synthetase (AMP-forming)/AMP-acid ligase II
MKQPVGMFNTLICQDNSWSSCEAIVFAGKVTTWGELANKSRQFYQSQSILRGRRVGLCFHPIPEVFAAVAALDKLQCDVFLLDSSLAREDLLRFGQDFRLGAIVGVFASQPAGGLEVHE